VRSREYRETQSKERSIEGKSRGGESLPQRLRDQPTTMRSLASHRHEIRA